MAAAGSSDANSAAGTKAKPPAVISVEDFSGLVGNMSRILAAVSRLQPFGTAELGLAEWMALMTLAGKDGISNKLLARQLGVSGQRANQIVTSLKNSKLITVKQSPEDNRVNEIAITDLGKTKIETLNAELKPLLAAAFEGKEQVLAVMSKRTKFVMQRVVQARKHEKLAFKKAKKAEEKSVA